MKAALSVTLRLALFCALMFPAVGACTQYSPQPQPAPIVVVPPVDPPIPVPIDTTPVANIVPYTTIQRILPGMKRPEVIKLIGREPDGDRDMRDGTRLLRWPAVNEAGASKFLDLQVEVDALAPTDRNRDTVLGHALVKR